MKHQEYLKMVILEISKLNPKIRIWQQQVGMALSLDAQRIVKYGLPGQADISGILPSGIRLEIEIKVGKDKQSEKQKLFQAMIEKNNGIYLLIDDKKTIQEQIQCLA